MTTASPAHHPSRILVVGRSPSVLTATVEILRGQGHAADATNQFDRVLDHYDPEHLDIVVFGGMVPADTKQRLRHQIGERNADVRFVQGLAGIAGLIAAQVESVIAADGDSGADYDEDQRMVHLTLPTAAHVRVEAWWATSFTPPEPTSTSMRVFDAELEAGPHDVALPPEIPAVASFIAVTVGSAVRVFTVGAMPASVLSMVPGSGRSPSTGRPLPPVADVSTHSSN